MCGVARPRKFSVEDFHLAARSAAGERSGPGRRRARRRAPGCAVILESAGAAIAARDGWASEKFCPTLHAAAQCKARDRAALPATWRGHAPALGESSRARRAGEHLTVAGRVPNRDGYLNLPVLVRATLPALTAAACFFSAAGMVFLAVAMCSSREAGAGDRAVPWRAGCAGVRISRPGLSAVIVAAAGAGTGAVARDAMQPWCLLAAAAA